MILSGELCDINDVINVITLIDTQILICDVSIRRSYSYYIYIYIIWYLPYNT